MYFTALSNLFFENITQSILSGWSIKYSTISTKFISNNNIYFDDSTNYLRKSSSKKLMANLSENNIRKSIDDGSILMTTNNNNIKFSKTINNGDFKTSLILTDF